MPAAPSASAPPAPAAPITAFAEPADSAPVLLASSLPAPRPEADGSVVVLTGKSPKVRRPRPRLRRSVAIAAVARDAGPSRAGSTSSRQVPPVEAPAAAVTPVIEEGPFRLANPYLPGTPAKAKDLGLRAGSDVRYHGEGANDCRVTLGSRPETLVSIDGTPVGATPLKDLRVPCGRRTIVWKGLTDERRQQVLVQPGDTVRRWVTFQ
jgi:hypothetical protein